MRYAGFVVALAALRFVAGAVMPPARTADLAWQRRLGNMILTTHRIPRTLGAETFTAAGAPWVPQEWAFSIAAALGSGRVGWSVFATSVALCAVATVALVALRAVRRGAAPTDVAGIAVLMMIAEEASFGVRTQVVAWMLFAAFMLLLDEEGPWMWAAVPLTALWANIHASVMIAPVVTGAVAFGRLLEDRAWSPRVRRAGLVTLGVGAAICCNPFGTGLPQYALMLFGSPIRQYINEWKPTDVGISEFLIGAFPLLCGIVAWGMLGKRGTRVRYDDAVVFALFTFLLFWAARNIPLFVIAAAPPAARLLTEALGSRCDAQRSTAPFWRWMEIGVPTIACIGVAIACAVFQRSDGRLGETFPLAEIAALGKSSAEHRLFCENFAWCSLAIGVPHQRVFLDGRADPYPLTVWQDYTSITFLRPHWRELLSTYGVDAAIVKRDTPLDQALALTGEWRDAEHDRQFRLWLKGRK